MSVVANVAINVDSSSAVQQLKAVDAAAKNLNGGLQGAAAGASGLVASLTAAIAPLLAVGTAVEVFRKTTTAAFERSQAETRLKALTAAYGETSQATVLATTASNKFGLTQTDATKAVADVYGRLRPLGFSLKEISGVYEGFNVLTKQAGISSAEAGSVFTQLSQALGSGTLRGDEFNRMAESMPAILGLVAEELGVAQGQLRKMAENGQITSDVVVKALQKVAAEGGNLDKFLDPSAKAMNDLAKNSEDAQVAIGKLLAPVALSGMKALSEAAKFVADNLKQIVQVGTFLGTFAAVINGTALATKAWAIATAGLAAAQRAAGIAAAFLQGVMNPASLATTALALGAATAAAVALGNAMGESGVQAAEAKEQQATVSVEVDKQRQNQERIKQELQLQTQQLTGQLQAYAANRAQIEGQIAAMERNASIASARYTAEKAILDLKDNQLQREYGLATTAQRRYQIATLIFKNAIAIAQVERNQALEQIKLDAEKIKNQIALQKLKFYEIQAEGELQILKAKDAQDAATKRTQLEKALQAQNQVLKSTYEQVDAQEQIGRYQATAVQAQYESKVLAAQVAYESRLTSKEIGLSQSSAVGLSNQIANSARSAGSLASGTGSVANYAERSAKMYIAVATNAEIAANKINQAANAQIRLNQARGVNPTTAAPIKKAAEGAFWKGGFEAFARGGFVSGPTLGLVGEGGEPEYIIPESKMSAAATNYLGGARGGSVIPSGNAQINVTTGPVMQQGGQQYVSMADLEKAMRKTADGIYASLRTPAGRYAVGVR